MTPELKKIGNKLFKTELGSHKVELAAIDDIKNVFDKLNSENSNINKISLESERIKKLYEEVVTKKNELKTTYEDNKTLYKTLYKKNLDAFNQLNKQAKDLGIDIKSIPAYKNYTENLSLINDLENKNQKSWNLIFNIK